MTAPSGKVGRGRRGKLNKRKEKYILRGEGKVGRREHSSREEALLSPLI